MRKAIILRWVWLKTENVAWDRLVQIIQCLPVHYFSLSLPVTFFHFHLFSLLTRGMQLLTSIRIKESICQAFRQEIIGCFATAHSGLQPPRWPTAASCLCNAALIQRGYLLSRLGFSYIFAVTSGRMGERLVPGDVKVIKAVCVFTFYLWGIFTFLSWLWEDTTKLEFYYIYVPFWCRKLYVLVTASRDDIHAYLSV